MTSPDPKEAEIAHLMGRVAELNQTVERLTIERDWAREEVRQLLVTVA